MSADEVLVDVIPMTAAGVEGLRFIMAPARVETWALEHAAGLVANGYVRLVVTPHVATLMVGDRRRRR